MHYPAHRKHNRQLSDRYLVSVDSINHHQHSHSKILTDHDAANYVKYAAIRSVCTNTHQLCVHSGVPLRQIPPGPTKVVRCREGVLWLGVYY